MTTPDALDHPWWLNRLACPGWPDGEHAFAIETDSCTRCGVDWYRWQAALRASRKTPNPGDPTT